MGQWYWCAPCCAEEAVDAALLQRVQATAGEVAAAAAAAPGAVSLLAVVHATGEVVVLRAGTGVNPQRALSLVPALKRAAAVHTAALRPAEVASVCLRGLRSAVHVWEAHGTVALVVADAPYGGGGGGGASAAAADSAAQDAAVAPLLSRLHSEVEALMAAAVGGAYVPGHR
jgi:hypothetical protein